MGRFHHKEHNQLIYDQFALFITSLTWHSLIWELGQTYAYNIIFYNGVSSIVKKRTACRTELWVKVWSHNLI